MIAPVTALWLYAVPLIDTVSVMVRRVWLKNRRSRRTEAICIICWWMPASECVRLSHLMALLQILLAAGIGVLMLRNGVPRGHRILWFSVCLRFTCCWSAAPGGWFRCCEDFTVCSD